MNKLIATMTLAGSLLIATPAFADYQVKSGDTMSEIAVRHNISLQELSKANPQIKDINLIYVGQILNLDGVKTESNKVVERTVPTKQIDKTEQSSVSQSTSNYKTLTVEATAYTAYDPGCSGITATGINLRANPNLKVIAVDPNVIPLGSKVWVEGYGMAIAGDTGGAIKGNKIDIFKQTNKEAIEFGRRTIQVKVYEK